MNLNSLLFLYLHIIFPLRIVVEPGLGPTKFSWSIEIDTLPHALYRKIQNPPAFQQAGPASCRWQLLPEKVFFLLLRPRQWKHTMTTGKISKEVSQQNILNFSCQRCAALWKSQRISYRRHTLMKNSCGRLPVSICCCKGCFRSSVPSDSCHW